MRNWLEPPISMHKIIYTTPQWVAVESFQFYRQPTQLMALSNNNRNLWFLYHWPVCVDETKNNDMCIAQINY